MTMEVRIRSILELNRREDSERPVHERNTYHARKILAIVQKQQR